MKFHTQKMDPTEMANMPYASVPVIATQGGFLNRFPQSKIIYLIGISIAALSFDHSIFSLALLALQLILWIPNGFNPRRDFKFLKNSLPFSLAVVGINACFDANKDFELLSVGSWTLEISTTGFVEGLFMAVRFYTILAASGLIRATTTTEQFVEGLARLKVSRNFALVLNHIFDRLDGSMDIRQRGDGSGGGKGQGRGGNKKIYTLRSILKGDFHFIIEQFQEKLTEAKKIFPDPDWAVICSMTFVMVALRLVKILPGLPFAPGFKNAIFIPLFVVTANLTKKPFSATIVGIICGIINFMFGFGKYGILGILQFTAPGVVVDLMVRLNRSQSIFWYAWVGFLAGLSRITVESLLAIAFGLPGAFYLLYTPIILTQCGFGLASAPLSRYLVKHLSQPPAAVNAGNPIGEKI